MIPLLLAETIRLIDSNSRRYIALHCRATRKIYCFFFCLLTIYHTNPHIVAVRLTFGLLTVLMYLCI